MNFLRALLGALLAAYLIRLVVVSNGVDVWLQVRDSLKGPLFIALGIQLILIVITTWRWQRLLDVQGIRVGMGDLLRLTMIGQFFSSIIPGAVGGDVLKMVYVIRHAPGRRAEAILTILVDRILGILGLFLVALVSVLFSFAFIRTAPPEVKLATMFVGAASLGGFGFVFAVALREKLQGLWGVSWLLAWLDRRLPHKVVLAVLRVVRAIDLYRERPGIVLLALGISVITHIGAALTVYFLGRAFHEDHLGLWGYFLAAQVANTVAAIPLTPNGFGGRDYILSIFFKAGGVTPAEAGIIATFNTLVLLLWSLVGGVVFMFTRHDGETPAEAEIVLEH